jgi:hypothetical protein
MASKRTETWGLPCSGMWLSLSDHIASDRLCIKDGSSFTVPITLIALHHGELALPKVAVTPLPLTGELTMGAMAIPSTDTWQVHGAEKILVLPRGGRSTFVVGMGGNMTP